MTDAAAGDDLEVEALLTDHYLASLLAARDRRAQDVPADLRLDPELRVVARRLDAELGRVHPSFHFEERLATLLSERAASMQLARRRGSVAHEPGLIAIAASGAAASGPVELTVLPDPPGGVEESAAFRRARTWARTESMPWARSHIDGPRPLLIGSALTSAAISLAGAYMAWRRGRPSNGAMGRAVRAVHPSRSARSLGGSVRAPHAASRGGLR